MYKVKKETKMANEKPEMTKEHMSDVILILDRFGSDKANELGIISREETSDAIKKCMSYILSEELEDTANISSGKKLGLTKERMSEIARMYARNRARRESVPLDPILLRRQIKNTAKELGTTYHETVIFMQAMLFEEFNELLDEIQKKEK